MSAQWSRIAESFNYLEVAIWPAVGLGALICAARTKGPPRRRFILAALVLFVFGASDFAEARTGNQWWHPWWLLLWKAACVIALLAILWSARTPARTRPPADPPNP